MRCKLQYKTESDFLEDCYLNELNGMEEHECYREPIRIVERERSEIDDLYKFIERTMFGRKGDSDGEKEED